MSTGSTGDADLQKALAESRELAEAARCVLVEADFATTARCIFDGCCRLTGATSGYVALLAGDGDENEVLFLEAGGRPCTVDESLPMPVRGLRGEAYREMRTVWENDFPASPWQRFMPEGHVTLDNVMFAPLNVGGRTVGIMGVANKPGGFTEDDARLATSFGELAAIALGNSRTRELLVEREQELEATNRMARVGGWSVERHPLRVVWSPEVRRIHEVTEEYEPDIEEAIGFYHPDDRGAIRTAVERCLRDGEPFDVELRLVTARGRELWVRALGMAEREASRTVRVRGTFQDVTDRVRADRERRELEEKFQQTQKLESLGILAGGIAHDFNNLLMGVLGNASLALEDLSDVHPARRNVAEIETAARRAADLCKQMLAYSGKGRFVVRRLKLDELVREMTQLMEVSITKHAVLRLELSPDTPPVEADATQIRQVVMNLVLNASEAIGERSGAISVSTGAMHCDRRYLETTVLSDEIPEGTYSWVEVSDTGEGMDEETVGKIFDPFFTTKFSGRGLGLAAVLGIVRGHGGAIKVYSEPGRGTTFKVLFPALEGDAPREPAGRTEAGKWTGRGRILVVDDDETVRAVGRRMLERAGFDVETAVDGREALALFGDDPARWDLVLLDLTMPHVDGVEAFAEMRRIRPEVRVVLSSGYNEQDAITRFSGKGLAGFVQKPYDQKVLLAEIRRVLEAG